MRITMLSSSYPRYEGDGTAPFIKSLAETFVYLGHDISVVAPFDKQVSSMDLHGVHMTRFRYAPFTGWHIMGHGRALISDIRLNTLSYFLAPAYAISASYQLLKIAQNQKSDYIYAHWVIPNGPPAAWVAKRLGIPLIISLHGSDIYLARKNPIFSSMARSSFKYARAVTACSPELYNSALELGAPKNNTHLIPWGVDPDLFNPDTRYYNFRKELGLKADDFVIGSLGRMVSKKGFNILIEAFKSILQNHANAKLLIGGEGPIREELLSLVHSLNIKSAVILPGRIRWDQAPAFIASLDLFVLPSVRDPKGNIDGLPTVLIEAMGVGVPIIASDIGGVNLVIKDGLNGVLVPQGNSDILYKAISGLITQPKKRERLARTAREQAESTYNWKNIVLKILSIMQEEV